MTRCQKIYVEVLSGGRAPVEARAQRTLAICMQRFKVGDSVFVLPRFVQLHQNERGVVVEVIVDPFRTTFNEYKIQFSDGSTANLFEFQIREAAD